MVEFSHINHWMSVSDTNNNIGFYGLVISIKVDYLVDSSYCEFVRVRLYDKLFAT